ncbi:MAG: gas vesicle protein GvpG [Candidatus Nealsonbacteria bacterium CG10_big_fil_rev_8_21_14_0_10_36_228]|uniref:Gas vesicle protein GvpG n=1 Tax=Candidatus Nealsonbacteria bacterium CG10_big_fil_rev_8_21_14_0_10_36_228 TaxID=1974708 RepID=A0A2H0TK95_9BACT|nr:MAG: gas vesicle protein GvpG [Candidatus Nealsonbacteria bacterium CG10_big_fil_rev_8_21_14_0_10_36_228]
MFLIDDLLLLPARMFMDVVEKIRDMAVEELEDTPEKLQRELLDAQMALETEEITEEEYQKKEKDILERMEALKKEKK